MKLPILILTLTLLSCGGAPVHRKHIFFRMDTITEITVSVPRPLDVKPIWRSLDSLLLSYEERFSVSGRSSEVRLLNERTSQSLPVSYELSGMLKTALAWGDSLDGAFDVTVLPLKKIWGLCEECSGEEPLPDSDLVNLTTQLVNYKSVAVNGANDSVTFASPDTRIDVGGIAKGFALRRMAALLRERGIGDFLISAGGDVLASGRKRDGSPWRVGVRHPRSPSELVTAIPMTQGTLVTSGDYERFRIIDDTRYHHIFDPKTGRSCGRNQSLTIQAPDPVTADVLSTGLFCKSAEEILAYVRARDGIECIVIDGNGRVHTSKEQ